MLWLVYPQAVFNAAQWLIRASWVISTPFGSPVDPDVYCKYAISEKGAVVWIIELLEIFFINEESIDFWEVETILTALEKIRGFSV